MAAKAVLDTGTSSGIGYSIAAELPKHGHHVIATLGWKAWKSSRVSV